MQYISVASGSSGNCHFIEEKNTKILIDAGLSCKNTIDLLKLHDIDAKDIDAIFVTHEHSDHIKGVGILSRKFDIPIFASSGTWDMMSQKIGNISQKNINIIYSDKKTDFKDLSIIPFDISHDAKQPFAYKISNNKKSISIVTDLGIVTENVLNHTKNCELVVLESNHDISMLDAGPYTYELKKRVKSNMGHLSNESAGEFANYLVCENTKKIMLAHLSRQNNIPILAYQTVVSILGEYGIKIGSDVDLSVLEPYTSSPKIYI